MVWEWPSPRNFFLSQCAKETCELECLLPMSPASGCSVRGCTVGQLSDSIKRVSAAASTVSTAATVSQYVEHEVQRGDWLCDIGRRHNVDLSSLLKANPSLRNPNSLKVGIRIKIPCTSSTAGCLSPERMQSALQEPFLQEVSVVKSSPLSTQPEALTISNIILLVGSMLLGKREYKVMEGDSLELIADKYGTSIPALKRLNNLKDDMIYAGSILKIEKRQRLKGCKQVLGRKLSNRERCALLDDILVSLPQPVKVPTSINPSFEAYPVLQRDLLLTPSPPSLKTVKVQFGDTLADIAYKHGLGIGELQRLNNLRSDAIYEGDVLAISHDPVRRHCLELRVGKRRTNRLLFPRYSESAGGPSEVESDGLASKAKHSVVGRWERKTKGFQHQKDRWLRFGSPLIDGFVSSSFGWRWGALHEGVDLAAEQGAPIYASDRGTVTFAGWSGGYGYLIVIQHEGGFVTRYAHCCAIHACVGQQVLKGQQVAAVGATGRATGPHLHFEVRRNGEALDPLDWVKL